MLGLSPDPPACTKVFRSWQLCVQYEKKNVKNHFLLLNLNFEFKS